MGKWRKFLLSPFVLFFYLYICEKFALESVES
nr:MAG TPA: hypothetical protein [Caudoviricetes sp.]